MITQDDWRLNGQQTYMQGCPARFSALEAR